MALTNTYTFEEGSNGAAITTASGASAVVGSPVYSTAAAAHGALGASLDGATFDRMDFTSTASGQFSFYIKFGVAGASNSLLFGIMDFPNYRVRVRANAASGQIEIQDSSSTVQAASTVSYTAGQQMRFDVRYDSSSGTTIDVTMRIYLGANSEGSTPDDTVTALGMAITSVPDSVRFTTATAGWTVYYDTVRLYNDTTVWPTGYFVPAQGQTLAWLRF